MPQASPGVDQPHFLTGRPRVFTPVITPFHADHGIDTARFTDFCRWLVHQGSGLAVFGTNSEANSLSLTERMALLETLVDAGIDPRRMLPGTGQCAVPDAVELTARAVKLGCAGVLMLPPFFYKPLDDAGLFAYYAEVIERVGAADLRVYLYHIPQFTGVPITHTLIERLLGAYPGTVAGIKDSSGDWSNTEAMLRRFPGFEIFPASEALLERALPLGAAGCISATANIQPAAIANLIEAWGTPAFDAAQRRVAAVRAIVQTFPMIPALKRIVGRHLGDDAAWSTVRPPLCELSTGLVEKLFAELDALDFEMPNLTARVVHAQAH